MKKRTLKSTVVEEEVCTSFSQQDVTYAGVLELLKVGKYSKSAAFIYTDFFTLKRVNALVPNFTLNDNVRSWLESRGSKKEKIIFITRILGDGEFDRLTRFWTKLDNTNQDIEKFILEGLGLKYTDRLQKTN